MGNLLVRFDEDLGGWRFGHLPGYSTKMSADISSGEQKAEAEGRWQLAVSVMKSGPRFRVPVVRFPGVVIRKFSDG